MKNWEKTLISPNCSLRKALEVINNYSSRAAYVVDNDRKLLGVLTDGDIRRGLLNNLSLEDKVTEVMNSNAVVASKISTRSDRVALMRREGILNVPIIDKGVIIGVDLLEQKATCEKFENPVFLMAGGFGTRLRPMTNTCPKPMLNVGGKPLLETLLLDFIDAGFNHFYISTHYLPEIILEHFGDGEDWGVKIEYVHETTPLGTGGALGMLPDNTPKLPMILMNGDILTKVDFRDLLQQHDDSGALATICTREYEFQVPYGVIHTDNLRITEMQEKPIYKHNVNAGIYVLDPKIIADVGKNQCIDLPTHLDSYIADGQHIRTYPVKEYWLDIGRLEDFERAQKDISLL